MIFAVFSCQIGQFTVPDVIDYKDSNRYVERF